MLQVVSANKSFKFETSDYLRFANAITRAEREWLVDFPTIACELGWCVVEPSLRKKLLRASEIGFESIGGQLMDAARCLWYAGQQMHGCQWLADVDGTHVVWHMVTRYHLARPVDNETV